MSLEEYADMFGQDLSKRPMDVAGAAPLPGDAVTVEAVRPVTKLGGASVVAEQAGRLADGKKAFVGAVGDIGKAAGYVDDAANFGRVIRGAHLAAKSLGAAGEALGALNDLYNRKLPWQTVVPGALAHGGQSAAASAIGTLGGVAAAGLIGQMLVPIPGLGYALGAAGGIGAGYLADRYLPSREQWGRGFHKP
jgi:hypothetical protein